MIRVGTRSLHRQVGGPYNGLDAIALLGMTEADTTQHSYAGSLSDARRRDSVSSLGRLAHDGQPAKRGI